jgi:serine/threonine protein phosphatase PrpC
MRLLTIGAFARAVRLTPKALRLYDDLGLLPPAAVDADSGYRFYHPAQLEQARLIARLRRVGMPLERIRAVCALPPAAAADEISAYWAEVQADTAARGELAGFLVELLSGRGTTMTETLGVKHAARTDIGRGRHTNEDLAYAGGNLLAVADGAAPGGERASTAAVAALRDVPEVDLAALTAAIQRADRAVTALADGDDRPVSTLTALLWSGPRIGLVHIGDSRAYLLRNGEMSRLTQDHTYVQTLVDAGRIGPEDAAAHPQRALLVRALGAGDGKNEPDVSLRAALPGDRYLLCTDGLSAVVPPAAIAAALPGGEPADAVQRLVDLAYEHGAPDNIAVVVADVVEV